MSGTSKRLFEDLRDKEARDVFVEEHVRTGPAYQIKALRDAREWSQAELGRRMGDEPQSTISRLENPNYGRYSIGTLLRLASAFDVALMVRFVSFGKLVNEYSDLTPNALNAPSYDEDEPLMNMAVESQIPANQISTPTIQINWISHDGALPRTTENIITNIVPIGGLEGRVFE